MTQEKKIQGEPGFHDGWKYKMDKTELVTIICNSNIVLISRARCSAIKNTVWFKNGFREYLVKFTMTVEGLHV